MKVKLIVSGGDKRIEEIARGIAQGLEGSEHRVSMERSSRTGDHVGVMIYDKVIIGCTPTGLWKKKTPDDLLEALKRAKGMLGKKTVVFIRPGLIRNNQALRTVMNDVERLCGAFVENFAILKNKREAKEFGEILWVDSKKE